MREVSEDGAVSVATEYCRRPKLVRITIADNGSGIAPEDQEKVFNIFVSTKGGRGTGLGLPVSQKIVKEHGGQIRLESERRQGEPLYPRTAGRQRRRPGPGRQRSARPTRTQGVR